MPPWRGSGLPRFKLDWWTLRSVDFTSFSNVYEGQVTGTLPDGSTQERGIWLFAVDDGSTDSVLLSLEQDQSLYVGRLDLSSVSALGTAFASVSWVEVAAATDDSWVADHWHVYAHGYHWLVYAWHTDTDGDNVSDYEIARLARFSEETLNDLEIADIATNGSSIEVPHGEAFLRNYYLNINDLWMVESTQGVAIELWVHITPGPHGYPTGNQYIAVLDVDTAMTGFDWAPYYFRDGTVYGEPPVNTMGSAVREEDGGNVYYHMMTGRYITQQSSYETSYPGVDYGIVDEDWNHVDASEAPVLSIETTVWTDNLMKPSMVRFKNGWFVLTYLYTDRTTLSTGDEKFNLMQRLYRDDLTLVDERTLFTATSTMTCGRPFCMQFGDWLLTCWDLAEDTGERYPHPAGCWIRIDHIPGFGPSLP